MKDSTGNYHADFTMSESGDWFHQWAGTGAVVTVAESQVVVEPSAF